MEISIYHAILTYQDLPPQQLFEKMETLVPGLFTPLLQLAGGEAYARLALLYIAHAYSKNSPLLVLGIQYADEKKKIAAHVGLPDKLNGPVVKLQDRMIREVVTAYLEAQQDRKWQHLMQDKILYEFMRDDGIITVKKEDGTTDYKAMVEAAKHRQLLLTAIEEQEKQFRDEYKFVEENMIEIKKMVKAAKPMNSLSLENSPHIS